MAGLCVCILYFLVSTVPAPSHSAGICNTCRPSDNLVHRVVATKCVCILEFLSSLGLIITLDFTQSQSYNCRI